MRRQEPVRHTCPDIDRMIQIITSMVDQMDSSYSDELTIDELKENIGDWSHALKEIGYGSRNELEDLRSANGALRDWGNELYSEVEELESEIDSETRKTSELEEKVSELENEIEELKSELMQPL